jgi:putative addiction module CopG family antidote
VQILTEVHAMSDVLPPDLQTYVRQKVDSGAFSSEEEFATAAVRLYRDLETRHELLRADVQAALDESKRGESEPLDMEAIKQELVEELDAPGREQ